MIEVVLVKTKEKDCTNIVNDINSLSQSIRLYKILTNINNVFDLIKSNSIDILLLDYNIFKNINVLEYYKLIENLKCTIIFTDENVETNSCNNRFNICSTKNLTNILTEYLSQNSNYNKISLVNEEEIRGKINKEIRFLGYNPSYNGTKYLIDCIYYLYNKNKMNDYSDSTIKEIYTVLAKKYNKSENTIKGNITRATSIMFCDCEEEKLKKYLGVCFLPRTGSKIIIETVLNKLSYVQK